MSLNFVAALTVCSDFGAQQNKVGHCFHFLLIYCHEVMGPDAMIFFERWVLSQLLNSPLSPSSRNCFVPLHFLPLEWYRLHNTLLIFLLAILIPACASSSLAFRMMYSVYKLNKQGDNIQPWLNSFPNLEPVCHSMSGSNCCFLTCIQISQEAGKVVWYSHLFKIFLQFVVIHLVKGFCIANKTE